MSYIQNFFTSRDNHANGNSYVGQQDRLWYNPDTNSIRISDGVTPGGKTIDLDLGANATFDIATACTVITGTLYANSATVYGELRVDGNISPAAAGKIGGIQPGPGVVISNSGLLTIDSANIPFSFGNFYANNNILSIVNNDEDMILAASGNAEIQLTGNVGFYKPDGFPPNVANRYFFANQDGQIEIIVPGTDPNAGAVNIIGSTSGNFQTPVNSGVMLQLTGQSNTPSRLYNDAVGAYSGFIARRYNGSATSPTHVLNGDEIARLGVNGYKDGGWLNIGQARISFVSTDNQDLANNGTKIEFWSTPKGKSTANITKVLELDSSYGANVIGNLVVTGNISGNVSGTTLVAGTANISGNVNAGNLVLTTGNIIYTPSYGSFYSNIDQTNPVANTAMSMTFNNTTSANGISIVSNSRITITKPGIYNIQFSAQVAKTGGGTGVVDIWLSKNGSPVDWTNTSVPVTATTPAAASWNFVENVTVANTYYEIMWSSSDTLVLLDASAPNVNPSRPGIPSVIATVVPVGA